MAWVPPAAGRLTSLYGPRNTGIVGASTYHRGVDIAPPIPGQTGRPVIAVADARVLATGWNAIRGNWVALRHDDGSTTAYQHLAKITTATGRRVKVGQQIGVMGNTSTLTIGVHLHFETFTAGLFVLSGNAWISTGRATDPVPFMRARGVDLAAAVPISSPLWTAGGLPRPDLDLTLPDPLEEDPLAAFTQADLEAAAEAGAIAALKRPLRDLTDTDGTSLSFVDFGRKGMIFFREGREADAALAAALGDLTAGTSTDVTPLLDAIHALPAEVVDELRSRL